MPNHDEVILLQTNLDDCTGEIMGYTMDLLLDAGALDVSYAPIFMKKNRPGYELTVMCKPDREEDLIKIIFRETSAIGMRRTVSQRIIMDREETTVQTAYGEVKAKKASYKDVEKVSIEFEDAKGLAKEQNVPLKDILK